ncbi:CC148 protein, partial [Amia calva]|nr:CC148 protein [Amia calva]
EKLTFRMKDGLGSKKYRPVDYQQLQAITEAKRLASAGIELKIHKTLHAAKMTKENTILRQHRQVWSQEHARLMKAGVLNLLLKIIFMKAHAKYFLNSLCLLVIGELILTEDRESFRAATVDPVWQLKDDLHYRLCEMRSYNSQLPPKSFHCDLILEQVEYVKEQQKDITEKLESQCLSMEEEINATAREEWFSSEEVPNDLQQIPEEVLCLECPYPDLKASLLNEFQALAEKYTSRLQSITQRLSGMDRCCGWDMADHFVFQLIVNQYPQDLNDRRVLYMDMLRRLLPHRSRQDLSDHERCWDWYRFTVEQKKVLVRCWLRDRADLLLKARLTVDEACTAYEEELALRTDQRRQQEICAELKDKLQQWRAHQEEVARLEGAIAARKHEEEEERLRKKQQKEEARLTMQKEKIKQYYKEQRRRREELERRDQRRLEELKQLIAEKNRKDRERVQFRQDLLQQHKKEKEVQAFLQQQEEEERQQRLENLKNQVAVVAELDPERMMGETEASKARHKTLVEEEFVLHRPLFQLHTYTNNQIVSDPRVRVEQALREAGLHNTLYAKEVLSTISPPRPARRDMESTVFQT